MKKMTLIIAAVFAVVFASYAETGKVYMYKNQSTGKYSGVCFIQGGVYAYGDSDDRDQSQLAYVVTTPEYMREGPSYKYNSSLSDSHYSVFTFNAKRGKLYNKFSKDLRYREFGMVSSSNKMICEDKYVLDRILDGETFNNRSLDTPQWFSSTPNSNSHSTSSTSSSHSSTKHTCSHCKGTGKTIRESGVATYGNDSKVYCSTCGRSYYRSTGHSHVTCPICHGKGWY